MVAFFYCHGGRLVGVAIIEAESLLHARMRAAAQKIGRAADCAEGKEIDAEHAALVPGDHIGRMLSPEEAGQLIDRMRAAKTRLQRPPADAPASMRAREGA